MKKIFLSGALSIALLTGFAFPASAQQGADNAKEDPTEVVAQLPDGQEALEVQTVSSGETDVVEESSIARKMTQAEKNENAKKNDSWGGAITIIAMCIVICALIVLSILFLGFGKIFSSRITKKKLEAKGLSKEAVNVDHEDLDSGEVIAAIGLALAEHFSEGHDHEDTILTIRRMKRAYSPWNSKIYHLRENPELRRNPARPIPVAKNK